MKGRKFSQTNSRGRAAESTIFRHFKVCLDLVSQLIHTTLVFTCFLKFKTCVHNLLIVDVVSIPINIFMPCSRTYVLLKDTKNNRNGLVVHTQCIDLVKKIKNLKGCDLQPIESELYVICLLHCDQLQYWMTHFLFSVSSYKSALVGTTL